MEPEYWKRAIIKLKKEDTILKSVIERNQKNILKSRKDPFGTLLKSIVGQQISVKAAESIHNKLLKLLQADVSPNMLLSIDKQALRETGLSRQKIDYLCNISKYFIENPNIFDTLNIRKSNKYFDQEFCNKELKENLKLKILNHEISENYINFEV